MRQVRRLVLGLTEQSANSFLKTRTVPQYDPVNYKAKRTSLEGTVVPHSFGRFGNRKRVRIVSVSHAWEAMQHPDPWGFQLRELCDFLLAARTDDAKEHEIWVFVDFCSLYQYKRTPGQQESFRHAMGHMHCLYAHAGISEVVRLERLTPDTDNPSIPSLSKFTTPGLTVTKQGLSKNSCRIPLLTLSAAGVVLKFSGRAPIT